MLKLPYEDHPSFRFGVDELEVADADIDTFNATYRRLEHTGRAASGGELRQLQATARAALAGVFNELVAGSDDDDFRMFSMELRSYSERLLSADLDHFAALSSELAAVSADQRERLEALERQRFFFGAMSSAAVESLLDIARAPLDELRGKAERGHLAREDLSVNSGPVSQRLMHVLADEFERQGINDIVSAHARRPMCVSGAALELSVPSATWWRSEYELPRAPNTMYAHSDEGLAHPKSIVYLTDVTTTCGPFAVYPGCAERLAITPLQSLVGRIISSVGLLPNSPLHALYGRDRWPRPFASPVFRRHFTMLPRSMRYNSHFGWDVIPDTTLEQALEAAETKMIGPAGTFVVFDGSRLLHRGGLVERGDRVALQVVFASPRFGPTVRRLARAGQTIAATRTSLVPQLRKLRRQLGAEVQRFSPRPHERLIRRIARILPSSGCIDIGASYYPHPPWEVFRLSPQTQWVAIEPNARNTKYLAEWRWPSQTHLLPYGLSERGGEQQLYVTHVDSGSSLLPPVINDDMTHRAHEQDFHDYFFPVVQQPIATKSLDTALAGIAGLPPNAPLVIKLDTQGTELSILRGAEPAFASGRIIGIETEATLLANPLMVGSGKFWEICSFLEARGFELLQLRPIEGGPFRRNSALERRTYLNECDAVFGLCRSQLVNRPVDHQLAALGFYLSYHLYDEARTLFESIRGVEQICTRAGVNAGQIRRLLDS